MARKLPIWSLELTLTVIEGLGNQLVEAKEDGDVRTLTVWGMDDKVHGRIIELDSRTRLVHVDENGVTRNIPFLDIMKVSYI